MLALFRTNQFVANIFLVFYAFIVRGAAFWGGLAPVHQGGSVVFESLFGGLDLGGTQSALLALLIVCFQALLINIILARHRMANELSLLPGMFYVLLASSFTPFLLLSPVLVATTFYLLALYEMLETYKKYAASGNIYNVGLWLGLASLFYPSLLIYILLAVVGLRSLRAFRFREQLVLASGFVSPFFLAFVYYFATDRASLLWQNLLLEGLSWWELRGALSWPDYLQLGFFTFLILLALLSFNRFLIKLNIQFQKNIGIFYWGLLFALLALFLQAAAGLDHLLLLVPSLAIFLSFNFLGLSRSLAEVFHLLLLVGLLLVHYQNWWLVGG